MKKILFFARDPGGAASLSQVVKSLNSSKYVLEVYSKDFAFDIFKLNGIESKEVTEYSEMSNISDFDLIFTGTSYGDDTEKDIWLAAKEKKIPNVAYMDHWMGYDRFMHSKLNLPIFPDTLLVTDEIVESSLRNIYKNSLGKLEKVGNPFLDKVLENKKDKCEIYKFKSSIGAGGYDRLICYFAEKIKGLDTENKYGFNEYMQFDNLCKAISMSHLKVKLFFCFHPKHDIEDVREEINMLVKYQDIDIEINEKYEKYILMQAADKVCGINSMALVEATLLGADSCSLQIDSTVVGDFDLLKNGYIRLIPDMKSLVGYIHETIEYNCNLTDSMLHSTDRVIEFIDKTTRGGR